MSNQKGLRIALNALGGGNWTGGLTYQVNLLEALKASCEDVEVFYLSNGEIPGGLKQRNVKTLPVSVAKNPVQSILDKVWRKFFNKDLVAKRSLRGKNINVLFPQFLQINAQTASIYWIPDFQFFHLPELDKSQTVAGVTAKLNKYFENCDLIVVSSEDARSDLKRWFPQHHHKARVLQFVAHIPSSLYDQDTELVHSKYHLPKDFIYLPNQFWAHKNHMLVLDALKLLRERGVKPVIACTGNPTDIRNPYYFANLIARVSELGLRDQFLILGFVDHHHVYDLIRSSKCVLNPSNFEGWSTSVEECKSVGKGMILSDLNVHVEQNPPSSLFFKQNDVVDLADKLEQAWTNYPSGPDMELETKAREAYQTRMASFGSTFTSICNEALQQKS